MNKIAFSITTACLIMTLSAVAQDTMQTFLKFTRPQTIGLYVAPELSYGQLRGSMTSFGGASAMFLMNKKWALGATAQMNLKENFVPKILNSLAVQSFFIGGKIEYTPKPNARIHASFPLIIGTGEASIDSVVTKGNDSFEEDMGSGEDSPEYGGENSRTNAFMLVQPGIHLEANLMRYAKFYVGVNYRLSLLIDNQTTLLPANTLQGFSITAGLKLGLFDFKLQHKKTIPANSNN